jgi:hypothetical protein
MMLFRFLASAASIAACAIAALPAAADAPPAPLRTIVYTVDYAYTLTRREQTSGFGGSPTGAATSVTQGHGVVENSIPNDEHGTLTVAVIAATRDGGLVVDVSYAGTTEVQNPVRVAIFSDGHLSYNPKTPLSYEARRVLPFLARGFVDDHTLALGTKWSDELAPPAKGGTTYSVEKIDGPRADIGIVTYVTVSGPGGFTEQTTGTTTYAVNVQAPLTLDLEVVTRREESINETDNTRGHFEAKLVSDTFPGH